MINPESDILPFDDWTPGQPNEQKLLLEKAKILLSYFTREEIRKFEAGELEFVKEETIGWDYAPDFLGFDSVETISFKDKEGIFSVRPKVDQQVSLICYGVPANSVLVSTDIVGRGKSWHGACVGFHRLLEAKVADDYWTQFAQFAPEVKKPEMNDLRIKIRANRDHWGETFGVIDR